MGVKPPSSCVHLPRLLPYCVSSVLLVKAGHINSPSTTGNCSDRESGGCLLGGIVSFEARGRTHGRTAAEDMESLCCRVDQGHGEGTRGVFYRLGTLQDTACTASYTKRS